MLSVSWPPPDVTVAGPLAPVEGGISQLRVARISSIMIWI